MKTIDVRKFACVQRHALIFATFEELTVSEGFEFVNDHKPTPLYRQFCQIYPDQFSWEYLEEGPEVWRMVVRRVAEGNPTHFEADITLQIQTNSGETP